MNAMTDRINHLIDESMSHTPVQTESYKKTNLRSAVCEYLDDADISVFVEDLKDIISYEEEYFRRRADIYSRLNEAVSSVLDAVLEDELVKKTKESV
jgi:hypothetical protein